MVPTLLPVEVSLLEVTGVDMEVMAVEGETVAEGVDERSRGQS
jgi:hypothetical protein